MKTGHRRARNLVLLQFPTRRHHCSRGFADSPGRFVRLQHGRVHQRIQKIRQVLHCHHLSVIPHEPHPESYPALLNFVAHVHSEQRHSQRGLAGFLDATIGQILGNHRAQPLGQIRPQQHRG